MIIHKVPRTDRKVMRQRAITAENTYKRMGNHDLAVLHCLDGKKEKEHQPIISSHLAFHPHSNMKIQCEALSLFIKDSDRRLELASFVAA